MDIPSEITAALPPGHGWLAGVGFTWERVAHDMLQSDGFLDHRAVISCLTYRIAIGEGLEEPVLRRVVHALWRIGARDALTHHPWSLLAMRRGDPFVPACLNVMTTTPFHGIHSSKLCASPDRVTGVSPTAENVGCRKLVSGGRDQAVRLAW